jgi:hypothetical protein
MRSTWKEKIPVSQNETLAEEPAASQEVITHTEAMPLAVMEAPAQPSDQFGQLMGIIDRLISNPELDLDRVERMLGMARELRAEKSEMEYTSAFAMMQSDMPVIDEHGGIKDKAGRIQSTYAYYEDIMEAVKPVMSAHGMALNFPKVRTTETHVEVTAVLKHIGGHKEVLDLELPLDDAYGKNLIQRYKSSQTYAKRIAAIAILNITTRQARKDDDDGAGTEEHSLVALSIGQIDLCETVEEMREWKRINAAAVAQTVSADENKKVVAHYQIRLKRLAEQEGLA